MGQFSHSVILFALLFSILGSATKVLPRAYHADPEPEALVEIRNVMLKSRSLTGPRNAPIARRWHGSSQPQEESNSPLAAVKRTLLGMRQLTCDPGYGLCDQSGRCCPNGGDNGGCCDDGTCVTKDQTCCTNGGACETGLDCCSATTCAPKGGECCADGSSCDPGLHCVILSGVQGCCADLSCTSFGSGGGGGGAAIPSFTITPLSLPSVTIPSFTPFSYTPISFTPISFTPISVPPITIPSFTPISITPISLPSITIPTGDLGGDFSYYTSTWTFYFYTFFLTTIPPSTTKTTSSRVTSTTRLTAYATDSADANAQFGSITADYASITAAISIPTSLSGDDIPNTGTTSSPTLRAGGGSAETAGSGGGGSSGSSSGGGSGGAASGGNKIIGQLSAPMMISAAGVIAVGMLAIWL